MQVNPTRLFSSSPSLLLEHDSTRAGLLQAPVDVARSASQSAPPTWRANEQASGTAGAEQRAQGAAEHIIPPSERDVPSSLNTEKDARDFEESGTMPKSAAATELAQSLALQQRRLLKLTDKTLLKRTQMLHEHQKVETCRKFLDESLEALMSTIPLEPGGNAGRRKKRRKKRKKGKQNEAMGAEIQADLRPSEDSGSQPERQLRLEQVTEGPEASTRTSSDAATAPQPNSPVDVTAIFRQYRNDYSSLRTQEAHMKATMDDLSKLDFYVKEAHEAFTASLTSAGILPKLDSHLPNGDLGSSSGSTMQDKSVTETPSLLAEYFSRRGDIGIYRERLDELEFHYHEGLVERAFLADRGDQLEVSDAQFEENYLERRRATERELDDLEQQAAVLADRCLEAGYDIDTHRKSVKPELVSLSSETGSIISLGEVPTIEQLGSSTNQLPAQSLLNSRMIDRWLRDIPRSVAGSGEDPEIGATEHSSSKPEYSLAAYEQRGFDQFGLQD